MNILFPLLLDGAMGTQLYKHGFPAGECPEKWSLEHPEEVLSIQRAYVNAGSRILYAPTFGANSSVLEKNGVFNQVKEYNHRLVALAREAADGKAFVAGDISSTGAMLYPLGDESFEDLYAIYREQAEALEEAGVDLFVIETMTNIPEARAALLAVKSVSEKPVFVSFTCNEAGRTMTGTDVTAALLILQGMGADAFGLNCSVGPKEMIPQLKRLAEFAEVPLLAKPNAGLPKTAGIRSVYDVSAEEFASFVPALAEAGVSIFGGCCGTDEAYIAALNKALSAVTAKATTRAPSDLLPCATERDVFLLPPDAAYSEVFSCDEDLEDALTEAEKGELIAIAIETEEDLATFADCQYAVSNPLCILCDDADLLERSLRAYQGRALYEGSLPDEVLLPLAQKYGLIF
ncbi:MAG: homocysteine S-methyltransferase family protein [Oscillospiraceae bacterium]|nr:homocysteine S-methyltransferase family protein [Oscillospiraceae bacterium]